MTETVSVHPSKADTVRYDWRMLACGEFGHVVMKTVRTGTLAELESSGATPHESVIGLDPETKCVAFQRTIRDGHVIYRVEDIDYYFCEK